MGCLRIKNTLDRHPNAFTVLFFYWLLFASGAATHNEWKKEVHQAVMSWWNRLNTKCIFTGKMQRQDLSKSPPSCRHNWNQQYAGSMCERIFVSLITLKLLCLSLFPMDECDFLLSYQRHPIFRMSRWFTVRLPSFSSAERSMCQHIGPTKNAKLLFGVCGLRCKRHCLQLCNPEF